MAPSSSSSSPKLAFSTRAVHGDDSDAGDEHSKEIMAPITTTTTFKHRKGHNDWPLGSSLAAGGVARAHVYSRYTTPVRDRVESVLGALEEAHAVTYTSGLTAVHALFNQVQPKRIIKTNEGYFGCQKAAETYAKNRNVEFLYLEEFDWDKFEAREGDLILLESPQNPRNEFYDYDFWNSKRSHLPFPKTCLAVDATFAPPPLQYPLKHGVDIVFHSSTKFLGGHSDLLGGVLVVNSRKLKEEMIMERSVNGWIMGSLEAWLLLRSLRTLELRVNRQSKSAYELAQWLDSKSEGCLGIIHRVWHTSLKHNPGHEAAQRIMKVATGPGCFSCEFKSPHHARLVVQKLKLFHNATSLGGVESLMEWRYAVDDKTSPLLVRISIGLEEPADLKEDMRQAFEATAREVAEKEASGEFEKWDLAAGKFVSAGKSKM